MGRQIKGLHDFGDSDFDNLIPKNQIFIPTGIQSIDDRLNALEGGRITLLTGRPGEGKTTIGHRICLEAVDKGYKVLIVDGEHERTSLVRNLITKIIGSDKTAYNLKKYNLKYLKIPKDETKPLIAKWAKDKLVYYSKTEGDIGDLDRLFDLYKWMSKEHGTNLIFLDNLMSLMEFKADDKNKNQIAFMDKCHSLVTTTGMHLILVAHPNKTAGKGESIDYFQVSGASELINIADNVLQVIRSADPITDECDGWIEIHKNRGYGDFQKTELVFDKETTALIEKNKQPKKINWRGNEGNQQKLGEKCDDSPF